MSNKIKKKYLIILLLPPFLFLICISFIRFFIGGKNPSFYYGTLFNRVLINPWNLDLSKNMGFLYDWKYYPEKFQSIKKQYFDNKEANPPTDYDRENNTWKSGSFCSIKQIKFAQSLADFQYCLAFRQVKDDRYCGLWNDLKYGTLNCSVLDTTEEIINDLEIKARLEDALKNPCKYLYPPKTIEESRLHDWALGPDFFWMYKGSECNKPKDKRETKISRQIYIRVFSAQGNFLYQKHLKEILNY